VELEVGLYDLNGVHARKIARRMVLAYGLLLHFDIPIREIKT